MMTTLHNDSQKRGISQRALTQHLKLTIAGNTDEWVTLFTPDAVLEFPYAPEGMPKKLEGREALHAHMVNFPKTFDVEYTDLVFHDTVDPKQVIAEFRLNGTALPTGKPYLQTCISVIQTNDEGLIEHYLDYWNPLAAIDALTPNDGLENPNGGFKFGE